MGNTDVGETNVGVISGHVKGPQKLHDLKAGI